MKLNIKSRNSKLLKALKAYIEEKFLKCQKYFSKIISVDIILSQQKLSYNVEAVVKIAGQTIKVQQSSDSYYSAVDLAVDKIERQLKKQKEKKTSRHRVVKNSLENNYAQTEKAMLSLDKKLLVPEVMGIDEAKQIMEEYNHLFWIFKNKETSKVTVLYRRADLTYCMMELALKKS